MLLRHIDMDLGGLRAATLLTTGRDALQAMRPISRVQNWNALGAW